MIVNIHGFGDNHAHAHVDGVRVRIRRVDHAAVWVCAEHGRSDDFHLCEHTEALAAARVPATKESN